MIDLFQIEACSMASPIELPRPSGPGEITPPQPSHPIGQPPPAGDPTPKPAPHPSEPPTTMPSHG